MDVNKYKYALDKSTPYIIWTKDQKFNVKCDTPMGMIDSLPTLGNMLGVSSKYSLGTDIMSIKDGSNMVVFKGGSFLTDKYYYNSQNDEVYSIKNQMVIDIYDKETTSTVMLVIFLLSETGCVAELLLRYSNEPQ